MMREIGREMWRRGGGSMSTGSFLESFERVVDGRGLRNIGGVVYLGFSSTNVMDLWLLYS